MEKLSSTDPEAEEEKVGRLSFSHFGASPLSFRPSPSASDQSAAHNLHRIHQRSRSFSSIQDLKLGEKMSSADAGDEERMDMLWEDFNEELGRSACGGGKKKKILDFSAGSTKLDRIRHGARELYCVKAARHQRLAMILKVLKKLIFVQKIGGEKRAA